MGRLDRLDLRQLAKLPSCLIEAGAVKSPPRFFCQIRLWLG